MTLTLTILGCDGIAAGPRGACSGYLLRSSTTAIWIDCGPGTLANLQTHIGLLDVDAIVCTHGHPDHWLELPVVANALRHVFRVPDRRLPVLWTASTAALFETTTGRAPGPAFDVRVIADGVTTSIGDIGLHFAGTDHSVETMSVGADHAGTSFAYSGDTGNAWELTSLGSGFDLALIEATLDDDEAGTVQHLTGGEAGMKAAAADVASLLLTHLIPGTDPGHRLASARATFGGPVAVAELGATYTIGA